MIKTPYTLHTLFIYVLISLIKPGYLSWLNKEPVSTLPDGVEHIVAACQEDNLFLQCRNRYNRLLIKDIFYGRDNDFTCKSKIADTSTKCENLTPQLVKDKIRLMCDGENKCKVPVTPEFLEKDGEGICPSVRKYVRVQYVCDQPTKMIMTCQNGCPNSCWPACKKSCCNPQVSLPPPPPPALPQPVVATCPVGCPTSCAPACSTICCETQTVASSLPSTPTLCPGSCPSDCAPLCTADCCKIKKTTESMFRFNQPPPTIQYNRHQELTCSNMCSPSNCLPSCSPACCTPPTMQALACPAGCPNHCAPACSVSCCSGAAALVPPQQFMPPPPPPPPLQPPPPPQPPQCPGLCSAHCAPLCSPTCCQSSQIQQSQSHCGPTCSFQCAPMCAPTCCSQAPALPPIPILPISPPAPFPQLPVQQPMPQVPMYQPPLPPMPMLTAQQKGCPVNCLTACLPRCPRRCCVALPEVTQRELEQRKTYQTMLQRFRAKQMQSYYGK